MWARIHLIPLLQAEEDRDQVRRYLADKAREKELLGSETRVYHSDRYVSPLIDALLLYGLLMHLSIDLFDQRLRLPRNTKRNKERLLDGCHTLCIYGN